MSDTVCVEGVLGRYKTCSGCNAEFFAKLQPGRPQRFCHGCRLERQRSHLQEFLDKKVSA